MSTTFKLVQTRPTTDVQFWEITDSAVLAKFEEYKTSGDIISYDFTGTTTADGLTNTKHVVVKDGISISSLIANDPVLSPFTAKREQHCINNNISYSLESE
jgi:hypothetical protein